MKADTLVTGANGFIGTYLVEALQSAGHRVYTHSAEDGDIATCPLPFDSVGHVFHLAGKTYVPESWRTPRPFYEVNVLGTVNVLEFCRAHGASLTYVSSYVYGHPVQLPIREDHRLQALNPYSHTKIMAEEVVRYYAAQFAVRAVIIRPFNIYGPGQDDRFLLPTLIRQTMGPSSDRIEIADFRPRRDYIYIRDLVALLLAAMDAGPGETYNAGSGLSVSISELVSELQAITGIHKPVHSRGELRQEEILDVRADISKAAADLHWKPHVALQDGLRETVAWMRTRLSGHS